jgi:hypothetical protein
LLKHWVWPTEWKTGAITGTLSPNGSHLHMTV